MEGEHYSIQPFYSPMMTSEGLQARAQRTNTRPSTFGTQHMMHISPQIPHSNFMGLRTNNINQINEQLDPFGVNRVNRIKKEKDENMRVEYEYENNIQIAMFAGMGQKIVSNMGVTPAHDSPMSMSDPRLLIPHQSPSLSSNSSLSIGPTINIGGPNLSPEQLGITRKLPIPPQLMTQVQVPLGFNGNVNVNVNVPVNPRVPVPVPVPMTSSLSPQMQYFSPMYSPAGLMHSHNHNTPLVGCRGVGKYSPEERMAKIKRYKQKKEKWRNEHPISRAFMGRAKVADEKPRYKGRFVTKEFLDKLKGEDMVAKGVTVGEGMRGDIMGDIRGDIRDTGIQGTLDQNLTDGVVEMEEIKGGDGTHNMEDIKD